MTHFQRNTPNGTSRYVKNGGARSWELSVDGHDGYYPHANETAARLIAYLGPYLFWGTMSVIAGGIWLLH